MTTKIWSQPNRVYVKTSKIWTTLWIFIYLNAHWMLIERRKNALTLTFSFFFQINSERCQISKIVFCIWQTKETTNKISNIKKILVSADRGDENEDETFKRQLNILCGLSANDIYQYLIILLVKTKRSAKVVIKLKSVPSRHAYMCLSRTAWVRVSRK